MHIRQKSYKVGENDIRYTTHVEQNKRGEDDQNATACEDNVAPCI